MTNCPVETVSHPLQIFSPPSWTVPSAYFSFFFFFLQDSFRPGLREPLADPEPAAPAVFGAVRRGVGAGGAGGVGPRAARGVEGQGRTGVGILERQVGWAYIYTKHPQKKPISTCLFNPA